MWFGDLVTMNWFDDVWTKEVFAGFMGGKIVFGETRPVSTYIFAFTAGKFKRVSQDKNGLEMTMLHRETDIEKVERNKNKIFDLHYSAISWMEKYTGIKYPFQKFDFALIPGFQYGGMEHPGAIFYKDASLFLELSAT